MAVTAADPVNARAYLNSYVGTYLREEVQYEGLSRNLPGFTRFLEVASFSQAAPLNISAVAVECGVERKVVESWFGVLEDLLLAIRLPVFSRRARRALTTHPKFFYFDVGVFRTLRPRGPLDALSEIDGAALETLLFQEVRSHNEIQKLGYQLSFWRTRTGQEVDLVLYGERGLLAFEVKRSDRLRSEDLNGLRAFVEEYPPAKLFFLYGGEREWMDDGVHILPFHLAISRLPEILCGVSGQTI
jgi:predicted AAA+ superfamily ATPase